jgi:hypothetical protein
MLQKSCLIYTKFANYYWSNRKVHVCGKWVRGILYIDGYEGVSFYISVLILRHSSLSITIIKISN